MVPKTKEKERAIRLRKVGKTYSEILEKIPVAKSTLALWLHSVGLARYQKQQITEKRLAASRRGGLVKKNKRIALVQRLLEESSKEVSNLTNREKWLIGVILYWAEGSKDKEYNPGQQVYFTNSDPRMIKVFLYWLIKVIKIPHKKICFEIYLHETKRESLDIVKKFWSKVTDFPVRELSVVYWKKHKINTTRKNTGGLYYGVLRVRVKASSTLNRKISGWIKGVNENYWGVV